jgi:carbon storage regulator CsrA
MDGRKLFFGKEAEMLVLSRRENEKIALPDLGVSVEVLRIAGSAVRLGVQAPANVKILREELTEGVSTVAGAERTKAGFKLTHDARNRLNTVNLALVMVQKHLAAGRSADAARTLEKAHRDFLAFSAELAGEARPAESVVQRILRNALVVEDNAQEGELLAEYLRLNGFCVDTAHDGCDALDYLSTHRRPDVVLLDMHMPRCDGPSTLSKIRHDPAL